MYCDYICRGFDRKSGNFAYFCIKQYWIAVVFAFVDVLMVGQGCLVCFLHALHVVLKIQNCYGRIGISILGKSLSYFHKWSKYFLLFLFGCLIKDFSEII